MVVHACLKGVVKQLGRGPPSLQMLDSISSLTESSNPRGCVACSEKYLGQGKEATQTGFAKLCKCSVLTCPPDTAKKPGPHWLQVRHPPPTNRSESPALKDEKQGMENRNGAGNTQNSKAALALQWAVAHWMGEWLMNLWEKHLLPLQLSFPPWVITQVVESLTLELKNKHFLEGVVLSVSQLSYCFCEAQSTGRKFLSWKSGIKKDLTAFLKKGKISHY